MTLKNVLNRLCIYLFYTEWNSEALNLTVHLVQASSFDFSPVCINSEQLNVN
jgi:hypothetical protein